jgi:hypothetical protein
VDFRYPGPQELALSVIKISMNMDRYNFCEYGKQNVTFGSFDFTNFRAEIQMNLDVPFLNMLDKVLTVTSVASIPRPNAVGTILSYKVTDTMGRSYVVSFTKNRNPVNVSVDAVLEPTVYTVSYFNNVGSKALSRGSITEKATSKQVATFEIQGMMNSMQLKILPGAFFGDVFVLFCTTFFAYKEW